jgi:hypothetical protein
VSDEPIQQKISPEDVEAAWSAFVSANTGRGLSLEEVLTERLRLKTMPGVEITLLSMERWDALHELTLTLLEIISPRSALALRDSQSVPPGTKSILDRLIPRSNPDSE